MFEMVVLAIAFLIAFGFACDRLRCVLREIRKSHLAGIKLPSPKKLTKLIR